MENSHIAQQRTARAQQALDAYCQGADPFLLGALAVWMDAPVCVACERDLDDDAPLTETTFTIAEGRDPQSVWVYCCADCQENPEHVRLIVNLRLRLTLARN